MAIRITGMYSGLDTESIISELVSAQSVKKSKYVKDQTKLSWKMDAWKALNTKIFNFYTNTLDNMRWQASYMRKATKVSNSNVLSVVTSNNAVNGSQSVRVDKLATSGKLTGRDLSKDFEGQNITSSSKLENLGIIGDASFDVNVGGKKTTIKVNGDMKISDVVKKLQNAGLNASFDDNNHRFFISSKESGQAADFTITANNTQGLDALEALGLLTKLSDEKDENGNPVDPLRKEYQKWADYLNDAEAYQAAKDEEAAKRAAEYKKANDALEEKNAALQKEIDALKEDPGYQAGKTADELYEELYGQLEDVLDEEGQPVKDKDGNTVQARQSGLKGDLDQAKADLKAAQDAKAEALAKAKEEGKELTESELTNLDKAISDASEAVSNAQTEFNKVNGQYSINKAVEDKQAQIDANQASIDENKTYYDETTEGEMTTVSASQKLKDDVKAEFDAKVALADSIINGSGFGDRKYGDRVVGQDAVIYVDGAEFTSSSNDFNINGMTITVYETTGENTVTLTTSNDVDGIYDMIKNFFKEYNSLINEMSALYNADSAKGYDPLTSEEKAEMADSEIEEWEKKIKDSLLRRDSTLGDLTDAIKTVMIQGATVNGKTMYLSDFGINTLGYFNAADNEKGAYHIYGDPDDADVKGENDVLKTMIASDPDAVMNFFSGLGRNLYDKLSDKMAGIKDTSSAFTVYNDKLMQKEYDAYKDKIAKEEDKLNALMDKWYEKFSRMETALAKLQGKSSGLGNLLGGQ